LPPFTEVLKDIDSLPSNGCDSTVLGLCKVAFAQALSKEYFKVEGDAIDYSREYISDSSGLRYGALSSMIVATPLDRPADLLKHVMVWDGQSPSPYEVFPHSLVVWYDVSKNEIRWNYANVGDYNLDGEVGIPDIYEIAVNYGAIVGDGKGNDFKESWLDGNGDGEVGIPDISIIAENYLSSVGAYSLYWKVRENDPLQFLTWVPFGPGNDKYPPTFAVSKDKVHPSIQEYWPLAYVAIQVEDSSGNYEPMSETFHMSLPRIMLYCASTQGGETGRLEKFAAHVAYAADIIGDGKATSDLNPDTVFEWDFGGATEPNTATGQEVYVRLGEPGVYYGSVTATHKLGSARNEFQIVVLKRANPKPDSVWIDAFDDLDGNGVRMDIYACRISKPFRNAEVRIEFDASDITSQADIEKETSYYADATYYGRWMADTGLLEWSSDIRWEDSKIVIYTANPLVNLQTGSTNSGAIASLGLPGMPFAGRKPIKVELIAYPGLENDILEPYKISNFDGYFEWTEVSDNFPEPYVYDHVPALANNGIGAVYKQGTGTILTFTGGLLGDLNGDYVTDPVDLIPITFRYMEKDNDGLLDEIDRLLTFDNNHEIHLDAAISVISRSYLAAVTSYQVYRDGAYIGEVRVPTMRKRGQFVEPWLTFYYYDPNPPPGLHTYWFSAYNDIGNCGSYMSDRVVVNIPET
jgi:hypothetical protein